MLASDTREEIERRALEIIAAIDAKAGPFRAQIVPDCTPHWHVVTTEPGAEDRALKRLSEKGFGVYLPRFDQTAAALGVARGPIFPRHLFVFVWDVLGHWRRVRECQCVTSILTKGEVPVVMPDRDIARLQVMEFGGLGLFRSAKRVRAGWRKAKQAAADDGLVDVSITSKSYWEGVVRLDSEQRIGALHRALGLTL